MAEIGGGEGEREAKLYSVQWTFIQKTGRYTLQNVHCKLKNVNPTLYNVTLMWQNDHFTIYAVHRTL